jgi:hypothetical protein
MRLLTVELTRLFSRRAVVVLLLVATGLAALMVASAIYDTRPVDATERAAAEQQLAEQQAASAGDFQACLSDPVQYFGDGATTADCADVQPRLEWFLPRAELDLASEVRNRGRTLIAVLALVGLVVGTTFCGADWASGSLTNQLLFVPRRLSVWLAKAVAVVVGMTAVAVVVLAAFWGSLQATASARGLGASSSDWHQILVSSGRGLALVAGVTLGGFALTMLLRSTVATLGLVLGALVVGEGLAAGLPFDRMSQWSPAQNVGAWLSGGLEVFDTSICSSEGQACTYTLTVLHAVLYLGALLAIAVVLSMVTFRRRDVA